MESGKQGFLHRLGTLGRTEVWEQMAALATNAAVIVVIAFIIAILCVGGS